MFTGFYRNKIERAENVIINFVATLTLILLTLDILEYDIGIPFGPFLPLIVCISLWLALFGLFKVFERLQSRF